MSKEKLKKEGTSALISDVWQKPKTIVEPGEDDLLALLEASFDEITVDSNHRVTHLQGNFTYIVWMRCLMPFTDGIRSRKAQIKQLQEEIDKMEAELKVILCLFINYNFLCYSGAQAHAVITGFGCLAGNVV